MKHILFLLALAFSWLPASAQDYLAFSSTDTLTNAGTITRTPLPTTTAVQRAVWDYSILVYTIQLSGTTGGTVKLQISNDGTLWTDYGSALTLSGSSAQSIHYEGQLRARYVRLLYTGSGTQTNQIRCRGYFRKRA